MNFDDNRGGEWATSAADIDVGLTVDALRLQLPMDDRNRPEASACLGAVLECVEAYFARASSEHDVPSGQVRYDLLSASHAAAEMQEALAPLADTSAVYDALDLRCRHLVLRARQQEEPAATRPAVPALANDAPPNLADLLTRIHADLQALRTATEYAVGRISSPRSSPKDRERALVKAIALSYRNHFGALPPQRSWFADALMAHIGDCLGVDIGHRIVGEVVAGMA